MRIKPDNYMTIQGWMRTELGLKGNELIVYALIYGFSQTEAQWFTGSRQYIAEWLGCTVRTVQNILDKLTNDGLIVKRKGRRKGAYFCDYQVKSANSALVRVQNLHLQECKNFTFKSAKSAHHNNSNINKDIYISNNSDLSHEITERMFDYE